jgi:hypothetical protein
MAGSASPRTGARDRGRPVTHWVAVPRFRLRRPGVASAWNQRRRAPHRRRVATCASARKARTADGAAALRPVSSFRWCVASERFGDNPAACRRNLPAAALPDRRGGCGSSLPTKEGRPTWAVASLCRCKFTVAQVPGVSLESGVAGCHLLVVGGACARRIGGSYRSWVFVAEP